MTSVDDTLGSDVYDEFGLLHENVAEWRLPIEALPAVSRAELELAPGQTLSYIRWGTAPPELVFLHGGGQNAHTWDTVALAAGRPLVAIDLPGHGHSDWRDDHDYSPVTNEPAVVSAIRDLAP